MAIMICVGSISFLCNFVCVLYLLYKKSIAFSIAYRVHHNALEYVTYGKPNPFVFRNAEAVLSQLHPFYNSDNVKECVDSGSQDFETLYMIGDNPSVDTKGAQLVCYINSFRDIRALICSRPACL